MGGPLRTVKLQCWQGVDLSESFVFFVLPASGSTDPQDLVAMNFTGAAARMNIRLSADPAATSLLSLTSSPAAGLTFIADTFTPGPATPAFNNGIKIVITKAQSLTLNSGVAVSNCYYDLLVDNADGTTTLLLAGQFDLLPTVSR